MLDLEGGQFFRFQRLSDGCRLLNEELYESFDECYKCLSTRHGTHKFHTMEFDAIVRVAPRAARAMCSLPGSYVQHAEITPRSHLAPTPTAPRA